MPGQVQLLWLFERERVGEMASAVRIGTRSSPLARWQAEWVASQLRRHHPDRDVALVEIKTQGDRDQNSPLATNGGIGVFTKEIQRELLEGTIDLAVDSLKDLPTQSPAGLVLVVVPPLEEPGDALIAPTSQTLDALPEGARVGTGSLRRRAQRLYLRPDLEICLHPRRKHEGFHGQFPRDSLGGQSASMRITDILALFLINQLTETLRNPDALRPKDLR